MLLNKLNIKKLADDLIELAKDHPDQNIELWAQDEARLGLQPIVKRVWAKVSHRPIAYHKRGYQWVYVYHFVRPSTGESHWLILPTVNTEAMSLALSSWVKEVDPGGKKLLVLLLDQAGWHIAKDLRVPPNVHLYFLPPKTPELQPVESSWTLLREAVANRCYQTLDLFIDALVHRCRWLLEHPAIVAAKTSWHWICYAENVAQSM